MPSEVIDILESLGPREVIGQAVGVLMTTRHVSRDAAFEMLVQASSRADRKVRVIAAEIVQRQGESAHAHPRLGRRG